MSEPVYKQYQRLYEDLVQDHPDDFSKMEIIIQDELVENALKYFEAATFPLIYPAKSYAVAIIYATLNEQHYGIPLLETLSDPDLFLGHDQYFKPYQADPATYNAILKRLGDLPDWIDKGWAPQTAEYWRLECTEEGIQDVILKMMENT